MSSKFWTRDAVVAAILQGDTLIVYKDRLLRISDKWLDAHPGGNLALLHFVGRDATDEIEAYHSDHTLSLVSRYAVGRVHNTTEEPWIPVVPPIMAGWVRRKDGLGKGYWHREAAELRSTVNTELSPSSQILLRAVTASERVDKSSLGPTEATLTPPPATLSLQAQARLSKGYRDLHERITAAGLYETPYLTGYGPEILRYTLLAATSVLAYWHRWFLTSAVFLGLLWHQLVFSAHDLGHMGVTHNWVADRLISILIADFVGGLSIGWWVQVSSRPPIHCATVTNCSAPRTTMFIIVRYLYLLR